MSSFAVTSGVDPAQGALGHWPSAGLAHVCDWRLLVPGV